MIQLELQKWETRGQDILERAKQAFQNAPLNGPIYMLSSRLPEAVRPQEGVLRIVFAGEYSAGKSTILKVLTGNDEIEIGAAITTQRASVFSWNGVEIVDTPGIHTAERPDHDVITYEEISRADLLVFVLTNELFDSHLAEHFRRLAIERNKGHEMLLVVNKMRRTELGNTPQMQQIIREDLEKVVSPFTTEQLRISFTDAQAALEARSHPNEKVAQILTRKSGIQSFVEELNNFIRDKDLIGRYTTALYTLEQVLQEAVSAETGGDVDVDGLEELLGQTRSALVQTKINIPNLVASSVQKSSEQIRRDGRAVAELIHSEQNAQKVSAELKEAQEKVQRTADALSDAVEQALGVEIERLEEKLEGIADSELARQLIPRLTARLELELDQVEISSSTLKTGSTVAKASGELGRFLVKNSFNPKAGTGVQAMLRLQNYSGTQGHQVVKSVGHFFGKSFKPWGAIKWTQRIAHAGRFLALAGPIIAIGLDWKLERDAEKLDNELREARMAVQKGFNDQAEALETHYDEATQTFVAEFVDAQLNDVDQKLKELHAMQTEKGELFDTLVELLEDTRVLIQEMHGQVVFGDMDA